MTAARKPRKKRRFSPPPPPARRRLPVRRRSFWAGVGVGLGFSGVLLALTFLNRPSTPLARAPWGPNATHLRERLLALALPPLPREGTALHIHQHLDLYLNGKHVAVPAQIGIDPGRRFISPIHTHDTSGVVHVESAQVRTYTLGQLFGVWGVRLDRHCIGSYCGGRGRVLMVYVDGRRTTGDPAPIPLRRHEEIVIAFGRPAELPRPVPSSYSYPPGE